MNSRVCQVVFVIKLSLLEAYR